jgi:hypothetical protein
MKKLFLFFTLAILSFASFSQNDLQKVLFVESNTSDFNTVLYDHSFVYDSTANVIYLLPTGSDARDNTLDSISDKIAIRVVSAKDADSLGGIIYSNYALKTYVDNLITTDTLTLDSSEIKTLNSVPIELLAAPGVGKIYDIYSVILDYDYDNAAYTGDSTIAILYNGLGNYAEQLIAIDGTADKQELMLKNDVAPIGSNKAVNIKSKSSDPVGPTANGTLKVYITYRIQELY